MGKRIFLALLIHSTSVSGAELKSSDLEAMNSVDHAGRVRSDGVNNYLIMPRVSSTGEYIGILDYVEVPLAKPPYQYVSLQCGYQGEEQLRPEITALVNTEESTENWKDVELAWFLDQEKMRIVDVDPSRVYCVNDAWHA